MLGFRLAAQRPPDAKRITDTVVMRFEHIYEDLPAWDTLRIVESRWEHLAWMHDHFADSVVSGEELLHEIEAET